MNILSGKIISVDTSGDLSLVKVACKENTLSAIVIDTAISAPYLIENQDIKVLFKETEVVISTIPAPPISLQNRLTGTIQSIEEGALLSKIMLNTSSGLITSVITTNAVQQLQLAVGMSATALIKTNEIMLAN